MDLKTNKSKKQYTFEDDQLDLNDKESELKVALFNVFYVLLKDQSISIYTSCLLAVIQFIHLIIFAFMDLVILRV